MNAGRAGVVLFLLVLFSGCDPAPLPGGSRLADGVYWRLNALGEGERLPADSDSVRVRVRMARPTAPPGSLYSTERWFAMEDDMRTSPFFGRMRQGDSATALLRGPQVPWTDLGVARPAPGMDTGWVQMELPMREIRSLEESRARARALLMARTAADEDSTLAAFLAAQPRPWQQRMGVWYVLDSMPGQGAFVQSGKLVTLAYVASFPGTGQVFDERTAAEGGLTFRLGDPDQVIKGLEVAAHLLGRAGARGRFLFPSALAFGPKGSSSGIVPPWMPVLYEVEVRSPEEGG